MQLVSHTAAALTQHYENVVAESEDGNQVCDNAERRSTGNNMTKFVQQDDLHTFFQIHVTRLFHGLACVMRKNCFVGVDC